MFHEWHVDGNIKFTTDSDARMTQAVIGAVKCYMMHFSRVLRQ